MSFRYVKRLVDGYWNLAKNSRRDPDTGKEKLDPVPQAPPVGWFKQPSMFDQVRDLVRSEHLSMLAAARGDETFEEANDFEVEDDIFPASQYEDADDFVPVEELQAKRQERFRQEYLRKREARRRKKEEAEWNAEDNPSPPTGGTPAPSPAPGPAGQGS